MQTATLGPFTVSRLCLGCMLFGEKTPVADAHRMLDRFLDAGGTFLDTADTYGDGEWTLIHRCRGCRILHLNRIAGDDNPLALVRLAVGPLARPPFPLDALARL